MEDDRFKTVSLIYGIIGMLTCIMQVVTVMTETDLGDEHTLAWWWYMILIIGIFFLWMAFKKRGTYSITLLGKTIKINLFRITKVLHFVVMYIFSVVEINADHTSQYGMMMLFISLMMGIKYRLIRKRGIIICLIIFAASLETGAVQAGYPFRAVYTFIFAGFYFGILSVLYTDELRKYFTLAKNFHEKLLSVEEKLKKYEGQTFDPEAFQFTPREREILSILCTTHGTNQEISDQLGIKVQTVKTHIKNIFDKAGVDDRHQLIDLFKHSYIQDET